MSLQVYSPVKSVGFPSGPFAGLPLWKQTLPEARAAPAAATTPIQTAIAVARRMPTNFIAGTPRIADGDRMVAVSHPFVRGGEAVLLVAFLCAGGCGGGNGPGGTSGAGGMSGIGGASQAGGTPGVSGTSGVAGALDRAAHRRAGASGARASGSPGTAGAGGVGGAPATAGTGGATAGSGGSATCGGCAAYGTPVRTGQTPAELDNLSGMTASWRNPGVLFAHNDMTQATVFALATDGHLLARFALVNAGAVDIEDIAVGPCPGGTCLYLADSGGNLSASRVEFAIYRIAEPAVPAGGTTATTNVSFERFRFAYPDGANHNAESLLVDPATGALYIITKVAAGQPSTAYALPSPPSTSGVNTLRKVADLHGAALGRLPCDGRLRAPVRSRLPAPHQRHRLRISDRRRRALRERLQRFPRGRSDGNRAPERGDRLSRRRKGLLHVGRDRRGADLRRRLSVAPPRARSDGTGNQASTYARLQSRWLITVGG